MVLWLSSHMVVVSLIGSFMISPMCCRRWMTTHVASAAEWYSTSQVDSATHDYSRLR
jgi:multidrug efflux pump subunit AcrB